VVFDRSLRRPRTRPRRLTLQKHPLLSDLSRPICKLYGVRCGRNAPREIVSASFREAFSEHEEPFREAYRKTLQKLIDSGKSLPDTIAKAEKAKAKKKVVNAKKLQEYHAKKSKATTPKAKAAPDKAVPVKSAPSKANRIRKKVDAG